ncbi:hypothetical protein [Bdellovibrio sp. HCB209]|uniref:hypothetical protein n=1 Tax=Bdellovibrio sp. HCB209 TaxID=3394354 RepID=UPI0039B556F5
MLDVKAKKLGSFLKSAYVKSLREGIFYLIRAYPELDRQQYLNLLRKEVDPSFESNHITGRINELLNAEMVDEVGYMDSSNGTRVAKLRAKNMSYNDGWSQYASKRKSERNRNPASQIGKELVRMNKLMRMLVNSNSEVCSRIYSQVLTKVPTKNSLKEANDRVESWLRGGLQIREDILVRKEDIANFKFDDEDAA